MPQRTEFHLVREALQILSEFELLQIPRVRGDELDRVQGPRADRRLVLNRLDLVESTADPELVDRLLTSGVDFQAFQEAGRLCHPACLVDGREEFGSGCRDLDLATRGKGELHPNEARRPVLVLDVRLGEGRFAYGTPEGRAFSAVEEALGPQL